MSFTCSIPATEASQFADAVDAAVPSPPLATDEAEALFAAGQDAAKTLAKAFDGNEFLAGSINGHAVQSDGDYGYESLSVSLFETAAPVETPAEDAAAA